MKNLFHITYAKNLESIKSNGLLPTIGDRCESYGETINAVYAFRSIEDAVTALCSWLGEELDEDEEIVIIEFNVPVEWTEDEAFETRITRTVPADTIYQVLTEEEIS